MTAAKPFLRAITQADADLICRHRQAMFAESGRSEADLAAMAWPFRDWLAPKLARGDYFGWIAEAPAGPVGGVGMMVIDWPPHPLHPTQAHRGYILNLYVEPAFRGQGLAKALMAEAMDEARRRNLAYMVLHATDMARPIYMNLGWSPTKELAIAP